jgi:sugar O-acyltransferase (sialic acid O-acetyltransferase NeuD family)
VMDRMIVIGGGGHAKVLIGVLKRLPWDVIGYTDPEERGVILGVPRLGDDAILPDVLRAQGRCGAIIGVGKVDASPLRTILQRRVEAMGFELPVVVSPHAVVNDEVALGPGTVILDGAVVNSGTETGRGCIVNTNSTLEHDCRLGDNVHIASGATVCGGVTIGHDCLIGAGATVAQGVGICGDCVVGAGAVVVRDVESPGTYVGVPAGKAP